MPITGEHVDVERKPKLGGGGPGKIPHRRGFGGGGDDGDRDRFRDFFSRKERLRRYRIGMGLCIVSVAGVFACLAMVFLLRRHAGPWDPGHKAWISDWGRLSLPYAMLWINSAALLMSSGTLELARRRMGKQSEFAEFGILPFRVTRQFPWLGLTVLLGFAFLGGQLEVWNQFRLQGVFLHTNPSSFFFLVFTGLHALHLIGGLGALVYALSGHWMHARFESQMLAVEVTAWYWHFMAGLWLAIFALLSFFH
jgi:cytochrome c oxidase subunit III